MPHVWSREHFFHWEFLVSFRVNFRVESGEFIICGAWSITDFLLHHLPQDLLQFHSMDSDTVRRLAQLQGKNHRNMKFQWPWLPYQIVWLDCFSLWCFDSSFESGTRPIRVKGTLRNRQYTARQIEWGKGMVEWLEVSWDRIQPPFATHPWARLMRLA